MSGIVGHSTVRLQEFLRPNIEDVCFKTRYGVTSKLKVDLQETTGESWEFL